MFIFFFALHAFVPARVRALFQSACGRPCPTRRAELARGLESRRDRICLWFRPVRGGEGGVSGSGALRAGAVASHCGVARSRLSHKRFLRGPAGAASAPPALQGGAY